MQSSFQWKGTTFIVSEDTVYTGIVSEFVLYQLFPQPTLLEFQVGLEFGTFLNTVTVQSGEPGFTIPSVEAPVDEKRAFYDLYTGLPRAFRNAWNNARIALANGGNPDLTPGIEKKDDPTPATGASATKTSNK
jgi:hypothetical protein